MDRVEQRARELLTLVMGEYGAGLTASQHNRLLALFVAALSQQPEAQAEARGGVFHELCDCPNGRAEHSPSCAALTEARNGR